ncbi:D-2-hydroxyacid dehydrogenase [Bacillaceae bacterium S4-13-56]
MEILCTARVQSEIKQRMMEKYPEHHFSFVYGMKEGKEMLPHVEILLTYGEDLNDDLIEEAKKLKWIMVLSAGMDKMPFEAIAKRDILVTNCRGIHGIPMAEYAIWKLLDVYKNGKVLMKHQKEEVWDRKVPMQEITGRKMVLAGTGAIAQELARLAKAFRMTTIGVSRSGTSKSSFDQVITPEKMDEHLGEADFLVSVLPSTKETVHFFKKEHFEKLPQHAVFLNMGRGDVVDERVLMDILREEKIAHAVLDVFEQEPLPEGHPFWQMENVTVTPHLSGITPQYLPRAFEIFEKNLKHFMGNDFSALINPIDPKRGY